MDRVMGDRGDLDLPGYSAEPQVNCWDKIEDVVAIALPILILVGIAVTAVYAWPVAAFLIAIVVGSVVGYTATYLIASIVFRILVACCSERSDVQTTPIDDFVTEEELTAYAADLKHTVRTKSQEAPQLKPFDYPSVGLGFTNPDETKAFLAAVGSTGSQITYNDHSLVVPVSGGVSSSAGPETDSSELIYQGFKDRLAQSLPEGFKDLAEEMLLVASSGTLPTNIAYNDFDFKSISSSNIDKSIQVHVGYSSFRENQSLSKIIKFRCDGEDSVTVTLRAQVEISLKPGLPRDNFFEDIPIGTVYPVAEFTYRKGDTSQGEPFIVKSCQYRMEYEALPSSDDE